MRYSKAEIISLIKSWIKSKDSNAELILFGSRARDQFHSESDWDLLILLDQTKVGEETKKEFREGLYDIELEIGEPISVFVFSKSVWQNKYKSTPLFQHIKREGIHL